MIIQFPSTKTSLAPRSSDLQARAAQVLLMQRTALEAAKELLRHAGSGSVNDPILKELEMTVALASAAKRLAKAAAGS